MDLSVVLTSAAIASLVSGLFMFVSQYLERRARQRELLLKTAAEWATQQQEAMLALSKASGQGMEIPPPPMYAYEYYRQLSSLLQRGTLTPEHQKRYEEWLKRTEPSDVKSGKP